MNMKINEIFYSLQGEGQWTGLPNIFIRTTGCNLRCTYCDTKYAYYQGTEITVNEILKNIQKYHCKYICITGGEPLLQKDLVILINALQKEKYHISIETNGSKDINSLARNKELMISMDIKCPSSHMDNRMKLKNISYLRKQDQIKFIIKTKTDYEYAKHILKKYEPICLIYFQPVWKSNYKKLANWIIKDNLKVKLGLQLHKIIWRNKRKV